MFKVTNISKDIRKFRDLNVGKDVYVNPKGFAITNRPPEENSVWKIEVFEEIKTKKIKEVDKL